MPKVLIILSANFQLGYFKLVFLSISNSNIQDEIISKKDMNSDHKSGWDDSGIERMNVRLG